MTDELTVRVTGLRELQRALKAFDAELPKELKLAFLRIAERVAGETRGRVPRGPTGRAQGSVKAHGTLKGAKVTEGGARAAYMPWLDFGGGIGSRNSPHRKVNWRGFISTGRYLYPTIKGLREETYRAAENAIRDAARRGGMGLDG